MFELSKVQRVDIRARAVSHLRNIDEGLAATVADGLGMALPDPAQAAKPTQDLPPSAALSILANGPKNFKGRKVGILLTDGSEATLFNALTKALTAEGAVWEVIAPKIGGVTLDDGTAVAAKQKIDGGPSVIYDAVAVLPSTAGAALLVQMRRRRISCPTPTATASSLPIARRRRRCSPKPASRPNSMGFIAMMAAKDAKAFVGRCAELRLWARELKVDLDAVGAK